MAHKKGQGSVRNGRDSLPKRRGLKKYAGERVTVSSILVTQCGTKYHPGRYVYCTKNYTLHAAVEGTVYFDQDGRRVNVLPDGEARSQSREPNERDGTAVLDRPRSRRRKTRPAAPAQNENRSGPNSRGSGSADALLKQTTANVREHWDRWEQQQQFQSQSQQQLRSEREQQEKLRRETEQRERQHKLEREQKEHRGSELRVQQQKLEREKLQKEKHEHEQREKLKLEEELRKQLEQKQVTKEVDRYYKQLLAWESKMGDKKVPRNEPTGRTDLDLVVQPDIMGAGARAFGASVAEDKNSLLVPGDVYTFLESQFVTTATGFVAFARAYPDEVADGLNIKEERAVSALDELIKEVARVLPEKCLAPVSSERFGYGTLD